MMWIRCVRAPVARCALLLTAPLSGACGAPGADAYGSDRSSATAAGTVSVIPTSDVAMKSIWGGGGGLPIYRLVDDGTSFAASDGGGTFARSAPGASLASLTLGFSGAGAGGASQVVVNYQAWPINGGAGSVRVRLYAGATLVATGPVHVLNGSRQNLSDSFPGLSVADANQLRSELEFQNTAGVGSLIASIIWLDVTGRQTAPPVSDKLVPAQGAWWGVYARASSAIGWDWYRALKDFEVKAERKMDTVYRYHDWGTADNGVFPDAFEQRQIGEGYILHVAWESRRYKAGTNVTWAEIKSGAQDAVIDAAIQRVKAVPAKIMINFDHEMDNAVHANDGPDADYVGAYRRIIDRFRAAGVTNVVWVWTPMGWSGTYARLPGLYPGDSYIDWLGYDPYNFYTCNRGGWKDPLTTFRSYYDWMHQPAQMAWHAQKPYILSEFSSHEDAADPDRKGAWMRGVVDAMQALPELKAVQLFDSTASLSGGFCDLRVDSTPQARAGYAAAGRDPYVNQPH